MTRKFRKQILRYGEWDHSQAPGGKLVITPDYVSKLVDNFKITPFAPVIRGHNEAEAEKDTSLIISKNIKGLEATDEGLDAIIEVDESEIEKYNDVSVSVDPEYTDHESKRFLGPVLKHVAMVVNPYIKGLNPFMALSQPNKDLVIYLSEIHNMEESTPEVTEQVDAEAVATVPAEEVVETETEVVAPAAEQVEEDTVDASEAQNQVVQLSEKVRALELQLTEQKVEKQVETWLSEGKIVPATRNVVKGIMMAGNTIVNLADGVKTVGELFTQFIGKMPSLVQLKELGISTETEKTDVNPILLNELRKLPAHKSKTEAEFAEFVEKHKDKLLTAELN